MQLTAQIEQQLQAAFGQLYGLNVPLTELSLQPTRKEFEGTYTFVCFPAAKQLRQPPAAIGQALGELLMKTVPELSGFNVVQGFLNLSVAETSWLSTFNVMAENPAYGQAAPRQEHVMVEYASPNTNKPLHLGHLRNIFLGYAVAAILKKDGYAVTSTSVVNNRGIHICKSMLAYQRFGNGETPESSGLKGDHLVGKYYVEYDKAYRAEVQQLMAEGMPEEQARKEAPVLKAAEKMLVDWEAGDPAVRALWSRMNDWVYAGFDETYRKIGVSFDKTYYESDVYVLGREVIDEGLERGVFYRRPDGSVWIDLTPEGLDEKLVLRSNGTAVYMTQDMGLADLKAEDFPINRSVYVVGNEQDYHFKVLFAIMKRLGRPYADGLFHLSYGMVDLPSGKMKSREGTVVDADDLMAEMEATAETMTRELGKIDGFSDDEARRLFTQLALGALKYYLLKVDPKKRMLFNPQESIDFQGNTGPYIQYNHARICSILRKAEQMGISTGGPVPETLPLHATEQELIGLLSQWPQRLHDAALQYAPSLVAQYAYELAKAYSSFLSEVPIFAEPEPELRRFRVRLSEQVARCLRENMALLGIEVPERM